jgi:hypothetical protein
MRNPSLETTAMTNATMPTTPALRIRIGCNSRQRG